MTEREFIDRLKVWFSLANFRKYRLVVECVVAALYFIVASVAVSDFSGVLGLLSVLLLASTIVLYRIQPFLSLAIGALGALTMLASSYLSNLGSFAVYAPLLLVFFGTAAYGKPTTRWTGLVGTFVASFMIFGSYGVSFSGLLIYFFALAFFALAWVAGMLVYVNRGRMRAESGEIVATAKLGEVKHEVTLEQERNKVARDVHDIVAHSLAVVIAQADGARYASKDVPAPVVEALENIAATARAALTDVRVLLGELRHNQEAGPQPGMNDLDALIRGFRDSGLQVEWNSYGTAGPLSDPAALAVYRIVQEGLTNALRHGERATPVELVFDWGAASLTVIVTNALPQGATILANTAGHGIPGMRERATLAGGELEASDGTNGRFRVRATVPFARASAAAVAS
ncbi:MAG: histidine kinase [Pseudolysinimonas sp.]|uniref:sensor histidine kinase n=1 Tax=Pseudolysinimonas sp. TaxID=2680009 RepID=UPI0032668854